MGEFRIPEDQMLRLMRCIFAASVSIETGGKSSTETDWTIAGQILSSEPEMPWALGNGRPVIINEALRAENYALKDDIMEMESRIAQLCTEIPKVRMKVSIVRDMFVLGDWWYVVTVSESVVYLRISSNMSHVDAIQWCSDRGFEVVE